MESAAVSHYSYGIEEAWWSWQLKTSEHVFDISDHNEGQFNQFIGGSKGSLFNVTSRILANRW